MNLNIFKEALIPILESGVYIILIIVGAFVVSGLKLLSKKLGIDFDNNEMDNIIKTVKSVIKYIDQVFVDTLKKNSEDGTLTDKQKEIIKEKSFDMLNDLLTGNQMKYLCDKYCLDDVDEIYEILIESNIAEVRAVTNPKTGDIIINEEIIPEITDDQVDGEDGTVTSIYIPSDDEIESIKKCPADCKKCTLRDYCDIARYPKTTTINIQHDFT